MRTPSSIRNRHSGFNCCNLPFRYCFHVIRSVTSQACITKPVYNKVCVNHDLFYDKVSLGCISQFSGERLQDHWSSCLNIHTLYLHVYQKSEISCNALATAVSSS